MPALIERPKMSRAMWEALKAHILREREKKKQEQEADAAIERLRRERENKQKQDVMTLEETKEQIQHLEQKLSELKEEKHQLFLQLKKVLNEDEIRRRAIPKETNDMLSYGHGYQPSSMQLSNHPTVFMQTPGAVTGRNPLYKIANPHQQTLIPPGALKRPRSPSPPGYSPGYNYKAQAVAAYGQKTSQFNQSGNYYHHSASQSHSNSSSYSPVNQTVYNYASQAQYSSGPSTPVQHSQSQTTAADQGNKHLPHGYHMQHLQQQQPQQQQQQQQQQQPQQQPTNFVPPLHQQQLDPTNHKSGFVEEKYYGVQQHAAATLRNVNHLHPQALISIQQQPKTGSITSGYPVRGQSNVPATVSSFQPPLSHQTTFVNQQGSSRHVFPAQPPPPGRYY